MSIIKRIPTLVGVIQQDVNFLRFAIYSTPEFECVAEHAMKPTLITPNKNWVEEDAMEIIQIIQSCMHEAFDKVNANGYRISDIATIGITTQPETLVAWDPSNGRPLYNAILTNDARAMEIVSEMINSLPDKDNNFYRHRTGLPLMHNFAAPKIVWLKKHISLVKAACEIGHCKFGTIDSWIIWNLTKGAQCITDVTNASHTMLMNIETLNWDKMMLKVFNVDIETLPDIRSCSEIYGAVLDTSFGIFMCPISAIINRQQASLLGKNCLRPGQASIKIAEEISIICNTGSLPVFSKTGLVTAVAYKLGPSMQPSYVLEAVLPMGSRAVDYFKTNFRVATFESNTTEMASMVQSTGDVYFVPALQGLNAPYWRHDARGLIIGLTQFTNKNHLIRAAYESICFQTRDVLEVMNNEGNFQFKHIYCDGPYAVRDILMQFMADLTGFSVVRSKVVNASCVGTAMCAAQAAEINLYKFRIGKEGESNLATDMFEPKLAKHVSDFCYMRWQRAVNRSMGWSLKVKGSLISQETQRLIGSLPVCASFLLASMICAFTLSNTKK